MLVSSAVAGSTHYLAQYPYLFVRETDQTDYFCTVCRETLKESFLQQHLFLGHCATTLQDCFVNLVSIKQEDQANKDKAPKEAGACKDGLVVCVVCWAKMESENQMKFHRETCKTPYTNGDVKNGNKSYIINSDFEGMEGDMSEDDRDMNGVSPPPFPQPEVIIDTEVGGKFEINSEAYSHTNKLGGGDPVYSSQCMQCSLCAMILPSSSYLSHLRAYHRVSCPMSSVNCPLCMTCVPIMDLTVHLASQHGLVPQTAVNGLLLWVLTSNTFSLSEAAQESLKSKFKPNLSFVPKSKPPVTSTPLSSTTPVKAFLPPTTITSTPTPKMELDTPLVNDIRGKVPVEQLMNKLTRSHTGPGGKQSHQCLVCAKWYAVPPVKHMRSHLQTFRSEQRRMLQLTNNASICLICYRVFDSQQGLAGHMSTHTDTSSSNAPAHIVIPGLPGGSLTPVTSTMSPVVDSFPSPAVSMLSSTAGLTAGGLLAEALMGYQAYQKMDGKDLSADDLPLGATFETPLHPSLPANQKAGVELDNAGRVKSGKVRKQCELCGEWSNIKWFFKHMSETHQALFCRCCREYLPKEEHKEHRHWHGMPPYMGQKIRIEEGQPIIIDRKERASLTPIGSLAAWGGSSGGLVVKAVDEINRKRKAVDQTLSPSSSSTKTSTSSTNGDHPMLPPGEGVPGRDSLMPKERCPVCAIEITHKNLARHIKLRHGIKYKFCYKCRKLIPGELYNEHRDLHDSGDLPSMGGSEFIDSLQGGEDGVIEIPEELLDDAMDSNNGGVRRKDDGFRANTSMTKLESLMGKEFKHPRRQCNICGYSVSYSNYKRHLRNAHPGLKEDGTVNEAGDGSKDNTDSGGDQDTDQDMVGHHVDDGDRIDDNQHNPANGEMVVEDDLDDDIVMDGYSECMRCGDHVMSEFMDQHLRKIHGETVRKSTSPRPRVLELRACPECGEEMCAENVVKHCRLKHKVAYKFCPACSKYIPKKLIKVHIRLHEKGILEEGLEQKEGLEGVLEAKGGSGGESELTLSKGDPENGTKMSLNNNDVEIMETKDEEDEDKLVIDAV